MPLDLSFNPAGTRAALAFSHPKGNIITAEMVREMRTALTDLTRADHVRLLTIEGAGADFSFGASVPEHAPGVIGQVLPEFHALIAELVALALPTAAVVRGRCFGGGFELALACDFIFAAETATFALPEIALGVFPPVASLLLPRRIGFARASSATLTGQTRSAAEWHAAGLVELVAPDASLTPAVDGWFARHLERHSAEALSHAVRAQRAPLVDVLRRELPAIERLYLEDLMASDDAAEGIAAFLEKRAPRWQDS